MGSPGFALDANFTIQLTIFSLRLFSVSVGLDGAQEGNGMVNAPGNEQFMMMAMNKERPPPPPHTQNLLHMAGKLC